MHVSPDIPRRGGARGQSAEIAGGKVSRCSARRSPMVAAEDGRRKKIRNPPSELKVLDSFCFLLLLLLLFVSADCI